MDATDQTETKSAADEHRALGVDPETGHGMIGEYPSNLRLRAEALVAAGATTDPDGMASDDLIAATAERLAAEEKAAADEIPSEDWKKAALVDHAHDAGIEVPANATKGDVLDLIHTAPAGTAPAAPNTGA